LSTKIGFPAVGKKVTIPPLKVKSDMIAGVSSKMITTKRLISSFMLSLAALTSAPAVWSQSGTDVYAGDWPDYHGNQLAQRYSPLDQINTDNVGSLEIAWRFSTENFGPSIDFNNPSTPLEVMGCCMLI
jgi:quinoprotein glucose dehydrogenase